MISIDARYETMQALHRKLLDVQLQYWRQHALFSSQWWLLVIISVLGWGIWWKTVDKRRLPEIVLLGAFSLIVASILDGLGQEFLVWDYRIQVAPTFDRFIPVDFAALPLTNMWLFQYFQRWKSYVIVVVMMSLAFSFVLEPFVTWIGVYDPMRWQHFYSFPVYIALALLGRLLVEQIWRVKKLAR